MANISYSCDSKLSHLTNIEPKSSSSQHLPRLRHILSLMSFNQCFGHDQPSSMLTAG